MTRRKGKEDVELNLAAMLDMAFQLLTFFILTFKPAPVEGQIELRLPPAVPVAAQGRKIDLGEKPQVDVLGGLDSLTVSVYPTATGQIDSLAVDAESFPGLAPFERRLRAVLADEASPVKQVLIQVGSGTRYDELMIVIEACTRQKLRDGTPLTKLSFAELPDK